jgi:hypothetical protein
VLFFFDFFGVDTAENDPSIVSEILGVGRWRMPKPGGIISGFDPVQEKHNASPVLIFARPETTRMDSWRVTNYRFVYTRLFNTRYFEVEILNATATCQA